jgi:hypothetical protein
VEIIDLAAGIVLRGRTVLDLDHHAVAVGRGLEPRETVVLKTSDGECYGGRVAGIDVRLEETVYTFAVGGRLPPDLALERVRGLDPRRDDLALHEVVDLLGHLRRR